VDIRNNIIYFNYAFEQCGGIYWYLSNISIINCTILYNQADWFYGGIAGDGQAVISNSIIWANSYPDIGGNQLNVSYTNIQDTLWPGTGNICVDPLFRGYNDFHLMATYCGDPYDSPCIDAGDPNILDAFLDCDFGLGGTRSDMGAYGGDNLGHPTGIIEEEEPMPEQISLLQNYPNPFNASTTIRYYIPNKSEISLSIYNLLGQRVETLVEDAQNPGEHTLTWDASHLPSGVYFARLRSDNATESIEMLLLR